jgi:hypothetical protein
MAEDDFSYRRFVRVAQIGSVLVGVVLGLSVGPGGGAAEMMVRAIAGGVFGLLVAGCLYLFLVAKDLRNLDIPREELHEAEVVLRETPGSMVHYRSGSPLRFWEATGGRLFLTSQAVEFRAHRGQPWVYRLTIPLGEIAHAAPCRILRLFPGGLRIERADGSFELFSFGRFDRNRDWAEEIMDARELERAEQSS